MIFIKSKEEWNEWANGIDKCYPKCPKCGKRIGCLWGWTDEKGISDHIGYVSDEVNVFCVGNGQDPTNGCGWKTIIFL